MIQLRPLYIALIMVLNKIFRTKGDMQAFTQKQKSRYRYVNLKQ